MSYGVAPSFADVMYRSPKYRYIHHTVEGFIFVDADKTIKLDANISGSPFPSHRLFLNSQVKKTILQGPLSGLWKLDSIVK
jgi:hypothetical protein